MTSGERADGAPTGPLGPDGTAELPAADGPQAVARPEPSALARAVVLAGGALLLLAVALLIANAWITRSTENRAAERASEVLDAPASVRLTGWPVGLRLLTGQPVDAVVEASDVPLPGTSALLARLEVTLEEVVVDRSALRDGLGGLEAGEGRFVAELDEDGVRQLAGLIGRLPLVDVELRGGVARLSVAGFSVLDATAEVVDGAIVFTPTAPLASFARVRLEYDELPLGFQADHVEIRRGVLRLEGSARDIRLG